MKILTKEEEQEHYHATVKGGLLGGAIGLAAGAAGVFLASRRFHLINHLTVPMKAFLVTSAGTFTGKPNPLAPPPNTQSPPPQAPYPSFRSTQQMVSPELTPLPAAITAADSSSRSFESTRNPQESYTDTSSRQAAEALAAKPLSERALDFARTNRYNIVGGSWVASMGIALAIVSRNKYLTGAQKLVQARVYAQGLTVAVLIATAAFEISDSKGEKGRWEKVQVVDPEDSSGKRMVEREVHRESYKGEDQWRDMIAAEEQKMKDRQHHIEEMEEKHHKKGHKKEHKPPATGGEPRPGTQP
ncbi:hypothetical protein MMC10_005574 [Thelotrema lepadinum]|nr:hypothetical protein [Thelotrema lepadinum]